MDEVAVHSCFPLTESWFSWEIYRCDVDCTKNPDACINEALYKAQTDALVADGYLAAGYDGIHIGEHGPEWQLTWCTCSFDRPSCCGDWAII